MIIIWIRMCVLPAHNYERIETLCMKTRNIAVYHQDYYAARESQHQCPRTRCIALMMHTNSRISIRDAVICAKQTLFPLTIPPQASRMCNRTRTTWRTHTCMHVYMYIQYIRTAFCMFAATSIYPCVFACVHMLLSSSFSSSFSSSLRFANFATGSLLLLLLLLLAVKTFSSQIHYATTAARPAPARQHVPESTSQRIWCRHPHPQREHRTSWPVPNYTTSFADIAKTITCVSAGSRANGRATFSLSIFTPLCLWLYGVLGSFCCLGSFVDTSANIIAYI